MRHTGFRVSPDDRARLAHGYGAEGDWGTPLDHPWAADGPYWELRGNGGILSTTGDLYRWHLALAGDRVLSAVERAKYVTPYVSEGRWAQTDYGYGWSIGKSPTGKKEISHIGGNGYFESDFRRYVGDDAVIILSGVSQRRLPRRWPSATIWRTGCLACATPIRPTSRGCRGRRRAARGARRGRPGREPEAT